MTGFTIKDVAREAKVSVGSVSRVLNGLAVSEAMKKKVDAAVAKLGYQPNSLARSMRTRSTGAVGFLVTDISNPLYGATINAVDARLRANGLMLLLASSGNRLQTELDVLAEFKRRRVDGLLMAPGSDANGPMLETLERFGAPIALMSGDFPRRFASVTTDYRSGVKSATRYLLDLGHRRIALLTPLAHLWPGRERIAGFRAAFREAGLPEQNALVRPQNLGLDSGPRSTNRRLPRCAGAPTTWRTPWSACCWRRSMAWPRAPRRGVSRCPPNWCCAAPVPPRVTREPENALKARWEAARTTTKHRRGEAG